MLLVHADIIPSMPLADWTQSAVNWLYANLEGFFTALNGGIQALVGGLEFALTLPPALVMVAILTLLALALAGWRVALFTVIGLLLIISLGLWDDAMLTLALILISTAVSLIIGVPLGIAAAKVRVAEAVTRPILDLMQTMPPFVYLVPFAILLGLGAAPALIATIVFSMPPAARLTMLGIQQVPKETVEAAHAFGSTPMQTLLKVELPLSLTAIKTGINQVIMLSLSMVVVAALIGAGGLGRSVVFGLQQLNVGTSLVGGVGIVVIAVALDRVTRSVGESRRRIPRLRARKGG
ncbi:MAG: ABC transporter permease [Streptosporangiales bacterium]